MTIFSKSFFQATGDPRVRLVLQQQVPGGMNQQQQQAITLQGQQQPMPNQQQQVMAGASGQNVNQTSPLLAQQLAGRPPVPGAQQGMLQPGTIMQQRPPGMQLIRPQLQPGQHMQHGTTVPPASAAAQAREQQVPGDPDSVA